MARRVLWGGGCHWVAPIPDDITYVRMQKGFAYLTAIIDWYSRFVLDWQLSITMEADFCIETLSRVLSSTRCEIFNTAQGSQFTSKGFIDSFNDI